LSSFLRRYLPRFYREEQREHAQVCVAGLLSGLQRKTCLPIAIEREVDEKPLQYFVGLGQWDDEAVLAELRQHVKEELGSARGIIIFDASGFPKRQGWHHHITLALLALWFCLLEKRRLGEKLRR